MYKVVMPSDQYPNRYLPTSPLSPKLPVSNRPLSPQPTRSRTSHIRQTSRNMHSNLPRYHPSNYQLVEPVATPTSVPQSPAITINRVTQPVILDSPRLMREKQKELLDRALLTSKIAASAMGVRPEPPRLDPLSSPTAIVTPLNLEDTQDYFAVIGTGKRSPATSPGARSVRSDGSGKDEPSKKSKRQVHVYQ